MRSKEGGTFGQRNAVFELNQRQRRWSLSDMEGENGVAFRSRTDSRVPWEDSGGTGFDEETHLWHQLKYGSEEADVVLASGVEARLIQAESELASGGDWLGTLNGLRAGAELAALGDPGDPNGRVGLLFEERARWALRNGPPSGRPAAPGAPSTASARTKCSPRGTSSRAGPTAPT